MSIQDELFARAQSGDRAAVREVLRDVYPAVRRIAAMLAGDLDRADRVAHAVIRSGLRGLRQWSGWGDPETWFFHQTVLVTRRVCGEGRPDSSADLLVTAPGAPKGSPGYLAFVRGIRRLPRQQVEAFLLHHAERLNPRLLGVSMDCSTTAAQTHLKAADASILALAQADLAALTEQVRQAGKSLSPSPAETDAFVDRQMGDWIGYVRAKRRIKLLTAVGVIAILAVAGWLTIRWLG